MRAKSASYMILDGGGAENVARENTGAIKRHFPRIIHCGVLITGGVGKPLDDPKLTLKHFYQVGAGIAYEIATRPWDIARRAVHLETLEKKKSTSIWAGIVHKVRQDGVRSFFKLPLVAHDQNASHGRRLHRLMRTLGRVGPWGIGFLVWEIYGGGV